MGCDFRDSTGSAEVIRKGSATKEAKEEAERNLDRKSGSYGYECRPYDCCVAVNATFKGRVKGDTLLRTQKIIAGALSSKILYPNSLPPLPPCMADEGE